MMSIRERTNYGMDRTEIEQRCCEGLAEIPEYRKYKNPELEYKDFREEMIWSPRDESNDDWVPFYVFTARSALTFAQESQGIPNREAMENSCTGEAEQYITDVLHQSEYIPEVALKTLLINDLPLKVIARWTSSDVELFISGIVQHGKSFTDIQKNFLPHKSMKEIVDFYYKWKRTKGARELRDCRRRRRSTRTRNRFTSTEHIIGDPRSPKMVTRSVSASWKIETKGNKRSGIPIRRRKRVALSIV